MAALTVARTDDSGRTTYEAILTRITGKSQYRDDEYLLEGLGYWQAGKVTVAQAVVDGAIAWFTLADKPKTGPKAKPGSKYKDIVAIMPASADDKASYQPPSHNTAPQTSVNGNGQHSEPENHWDERERHIRLGMAFNNLTVMLASGNPEVQSDAKWNQWEAWYAQASRGLPLQPASDADEQPADEAPESPAELPWDEAPARAATH